MKKYKGPRISQCMIVKNEEKNIRQALSWGKGIVSEQIVVDTGSTDRTVDIAQEMGAKVYHFQWIDDFAAAKNFAISKARYEWIALLDADEYMTSKDAKKLLGYVRELHPTDCESLITGWIHLDDKGGVIAVSSQIRVFRNMPSLRYKRRIHEYLEIPGRKIEVADITGDVSIYHTGYQKEASRKKTGAGRNFKLIQAELEDHPEDYELYGYLGNEYEAMSQWQDAKRCYEKAVELMPEVMKGQYDMSTSGFYFRLLELLSALRDTTERELVDLYQRAVEGWPEDGDFDYIMGKYYAGRGDYRTGEKHLVQAFNRLEQYGNTLRSQLLAGKIMEAYELLAICYFNNGKLEECVKLITALLKENPYLMSALVVMISAYKRDMTASGRGEAGAGEVAGFLGRAFYDFGTMKDRLFVLRAAMGARYGELVTVMRRSFSPEELAAVDKALSGDRGQAPAEEYGGQAGREDAVEGSGEIRDTREQASHGGSMEETKDRGSEKIKTGGPRLVLFYSEVESFNFFTDQLRYHLEKKGCQVFVLDLQRLSAGSEGVYEDVDRFERFLSEKVDGVICFDGLGTREEELIAIWDEHGAVVVDIFMDPPLRFHPVLEKHSKNYHLFCCDREHVEYVKRYFGKEVPSVGFMSHVGVMPEGDTRTIPYRERKYDILFCGTYYSPEAKFEEMGKTFPKDSAAYKLYERTYENLKADSSLSVWKGMLFTRDQLGWDIPNHVLKAMLWGAEPMDWAIRMYDRGRVITALAKSGMNIHLLGRGWENHPTAGMANVHRIADRIPYGDTLAYMGDARINLNIMPGFKEGTHDRIFNTLLRRSVPLTDSSAWIDEHFVDGKDIRLYDLKHLERLPDIAGRLLEDEALAETIIENGYEKVAGTWTWDKCADWLLEVIRGNGGMNG